MPKRGLIRRLAGALRIALHHWRTLYAVPLNMLSRVMPFGTITIQRLRGVRIGRGCIICREVFIDDVDPRLVEIGNDVMIAPGVRIFAHVHYGPRLYEYMGGRQTAPVKICDGAYLGANAVVLKGVTVGECALVGAGSVASRDVPPYAVAIGVPARVVRRLEKRYRRPEEAIGDLNLYDVFFREARPLDGPDDAADHPYGALGGAAPDGDD